MGVDDHLSHDDDLLDFFQECFRDNINQGSSINQPENVDRRDQELMDFADFPDFNDLIDSDDLNDSIDSDDLNDLNDSDDLNELPALPDELFSIDLTRAIENFVDDHPPSVEDHQPIEDIVTIDKGDDEIQPLPTSSSNHGMQLRPRRPRTNPMEVNESSEQNPKAKKARKKKRKPKPILLKSFATFVKYYPR